MVLEFMPKFYFGTSTNFFTPMVLQLFLACQIGNSVNISVNLRAKIVKYIYKLTTF